MSCYICDKSTMLTVLKAWLMCDYVYIKTQEDLDTAWLEINEANFQAYGDRYNTKDITIPEERKNCPLAIEDWFVAEAEDKPDRLERYKALKEYMYQCAEGEYHNRPGYYQSEWCLAEMLRDYITKEFGEEE